ncbi:MAG: Ribokinase [Phycisphaerales bacterium]|nr:Ribokinase [Phycisphaerales bacterium]
MPKRPRLVVIGSINTDLVQPSPRLPLPGETMHGGDLTVVPGGKGANQAVAAARLGADVAMVGRVGRDTFGEALRDGLAAEGIDVRHVHFTPGASGTAVILVQPSGENSIVLSPGANAKVTPADVDRARTLIRAADAVLLQLEIPPATVRHAIKLCRALGVTVFLDPAPPLAMAGKAKKVPRWLFDADVLSPNEHEARALLAVRASKRPMKDAAVAVALARAGAADVVLKLGGRGAMHADASHVVTHTPAMKIKPVDTTAAGDAFTAALAVARAEGQNWADAQRFANAAGAVTCLTHGAQPSLPTRRAVNQFLRS